MLENLGRFCRDCMCSFVGRFVGKNEAKKRGFTLAEILIALAIIGILAVLVLPAVTTRAQNRGFELSYDAQVKNLLNALESLPVAENRSSLTDTMMYTDNPNLTDYSDTSGAFIKKYMKVSKYCGNTPSGCFANQYTEIKNHDKITYSTNSIKGACAILKNGVSICIKPQAKPNANEKTYVTGYLDLNGPKGPNMYGRDLRSFMVDVGEAKVYNAENPESVVTLNDIDPDGPSTCEGGICDPCVVDPDSCNNECTKANAPASFECCKAKYHPTITGPNDACCAFRVDAKCNKCQDATYKANHPDECGGSCAGHTITGPNDACCTAEMKAKEPKCCSDSDDSNFCCSANAFTFGCCKKSAANGDIRDSGHKCCQVFKNNGGENGAFYKKYCTDACTEDRNSEFCCKTPQRQDQMANPTKNSNGSAKFDGCCSTNSGKSNKKCCNWSYGSSAGSNDVAKACCNLGGTYIQKQTSCCTNDSVFNSNKRDCCTYNNDRKKTSACCEFRTGTPDAPSGNTYDACCSANADGSYSIGNQSGQSVNCCKPNSTSAYCCANAFDKLNSDAKKTCCANNFNAGKCCSSEGKDINGKDNAQCCSNEKKTTQVCCNAAGVQNMTDEQVCGNPNLSSCRDCGCYGDKANSSEKCCSSNSNHDSNWVSKCCSYNKIDPYQSGSATECCTLSKTLSNPNKTCCDALYPNASAEDKQKLKDKCCNVDGWQYSSVCKPTPDSEPNTCQPGYSSVDVICGVRQKGPKSEIYCSIDAGEGVDISRYYATLNNYEAVANGNTSFLDDENKILDRECPVEVNGNSNACSFSDDVLNDCLTWGNNSDGSYGFAFLKLGGCSLYKDKLDNKLADGTIFKGDSDTNSSSYAFNSKYGIRDLNDLYKYLDEGPITCRIHYCDKNEVCTGDTCSITRCMTPAVKAPPISSQQCRQEKHKYGFNDCCIYPDCLDLGESSGNTNGWDKDYWAGAVKYCHDKGMRLPTLDEINQLASCIYGKSVSGKGTDNVPLNKCKIPDQLAPLKENSYMVVWTSNEVNYDSAQARTFDTTSTYLTVGDPFRTNPSYQVYRRNMDVPYTICVSNDEDVCFPQDKPDDQCSIEDLKGCSENHYISWDIEYDDSDEGQIGADFDFHGDSPKDWIYNLYVLYDYDRQVDSCHREGSMATDYRYVCDGTSNETITQQRFDIPTDNSTAYVSANAHNARGNCGCVHHDVSDSLKCKVYLNDKLISEDCSGDYNSCDGKQASRAANNFENTDINKCCVDLAGNPEANPYCCTKDSSDEGCCSYMKSIKGDAWIKQNAPQCIPNPCLSGNMAQCCQDEQNDLNFFDSEEDWANTCCLQKDASGSKYVIDSDHRCCNYYWDNNSQNYYYTPQKDKGYGKYEDATENICRGGAIDEGCRYQEEELINCQTNFESFDSYSHGYGINDQLKSQYAQYVERQIKGRNGKYPSVTCTVKNGVTGTLEYLDGKKECHYSDWYCEANGYTYIPTSKTFSGGSFTIDNVLRIKSVKINYLNTKNLELVRNGSYTYGFKLKLVPNTDVTPCIPEFQQTPYGYGSYCSIAAPTGRMYQYGDKASIVQTGSCSKNLNTQYTYTEKAGSNNDPYHYHTTLHKWVPAGSDACWPPGSDGSNTQMYSSFCKYCTVEQGTVKTFWDFPKHPDDDNACVAHRRVDILACKLNGNTLSPTIIGGKAYCLIDGSPLVVNTGNTYTMNYRCPDLVSWGHGSSEIDSEIKISNQGVLNYHFNFVTEYEYCWDEDVEVDQDCYEEDGTEYCDPVYEQEEVCESRYPDENGNDMLIIIAEIKYSSGGRTHLKTFNVTTSKENNSGSIQLEPDAKLLSGKITYMMRRIRKSDNVDAAPPMVLYVDTFEDNEYSSNVTVDAPKIIPCPD